MRRRSLLAFFVILVAASGLASEKERKEPTSRLFALIDRADEIVVYGEDFKRESVIYSSSDRKDFSDLKAAISLRPQGGPFVCACIDGPVIVLLREKREIASVWNHEGTAIGSSAWKGDWENSDPDRWLRWFDARGMKFARERFNEDRAREKQSVLDEERWFKAMPSSLQPLWSGFLAHYDVTAQTVDSKTLDDALVQQYPDTENRIRALMAWYGSGAGPWSGFPAYEQIAAQLLHEYPTSELIQVVDGRELNEQELEGAARILGSWTPVPDTTPIPEELKQRLLVHCLKSSDEDKVGRARKKFGPGE